MTILSKSFLILESIYSLRWDVSKGSVISKARLIQNMTIKDLSVMVASHGIECSEFYLEQLESGGFISIEIEKFIILMYLLDLDLKDFYSNDFLTVLP